MCEVGGKQAATHEPHLSVSQAQQVSLHAGSGGQDCPDTTIYACNYSSKKQVTI